MEGGEELRVPLSDDELDRLRRVSDAAGTDVESWAKAVILRQLRETGDASTLGGTDGETSSPSSSPDGPEP
jgi:hypothetical protein